MQWLEKLIERNVLNRIPFKVIWWTDSHLNHIPLLFRFKSSSCVWFWFCEYADWRHYMEEYDG